MDAEIPDGFVPLFRTSPFIDTVGPLYQRGFGAGMSLGFRVAPKHANMRGQLHGGVVATVADIALGYALSTASDPPRSMVTTSLTVDFVASAAVGDWVESRVDIQRMGNKLSFANTYFFVGENRIARASGVFFAVDPSRRSSTS